MSTFNEANQARLSLKMLLSFYSWFHSASVQSEDNEYSVVICVYRLDNSIRKIIPAVHKGVSVKVDLINGK